MALSGAYASYSDVNASGATGPGNFPPSIVAELDVRIYRTFSLFGFGGQTETGTNSFAGAGLRVDLPGFFFLWSRNSDLWRSNKRYPLNTSIHGGFLRFSDPIVVSTLPLTGLNARGGMTIDWMLPGKAIFISIDASLVLLGTDSFVTTSAGLGFVL
ncbi:MAG: hypothetical protein ABL958_01710 [Bdellovibrionia bacterium]